MNREMEIIYEAANRAARADLGQFGSPELEAAADNGRRTAVNAIMDMLAVYAPAEPEYTLAEVFDEVFGHSTEHRPDA